MQPRIIDGYWDCKYCGSTKNRGKERNCPHCGHPRDKDVRFYMVETDNFANISNKNPDWVCLFCGSLNSNMADMCPGCGAPKGLSKDDYFSQKQSGITRKRQPRSPEASRKAVDTRRRNERRISLAIFLSVLGFAAIVVGITILLQISAKRTATGTVTELSWERAIDVEEYRTIQENGWMLPADGRLIRTASEIRSYNQVLDHYKKQSRTVEVLDHYEDYVSGYRDLGNGYFEEIVSQKPVYRTEIEYYDEPVYISVPVYDTKYYYDIDKWVFDKTLNEFGTDSEPYWPKFEPSEKRREGMRRETYTVQFTVEDKTYSQNTDYETWTSIQKNTNVPVSKPLFGKPKIKFEEIGSEN